MNSLINLALIGASGVVGKKIIYLLENKNVEINNFYPLGSSSVGDEIVFNNKEYKVFSNKKINTNNTHGTGCTLSSAVATFLSCGKPINKSCELAIKYVNQSLKTRINYGKGHGPVNHLNSFTLESKFK